MCVVSATSAKKIQAASKPVSSPPAVQTRRDERSFVVEDSEDLVNPHEAETLFSFDEECDSSPVENDSDDAMHGLTLRDIFFVEG
mmetsp:Transcript_64068/g.139351  ORF Transcript_64068/g.139351 Transcript_64068/m.139351 type:complete len:85 (+) Transcript_64068:104-358(+)